MILRDISIIWILINLDFLFEKLHGSRYTKKVTYIIKSIVITFIIALTIFNYYYFGGTIANNLIIVCDFIPFLILHYILSGQRNGDFFFTVTLIGVTTLWIAYATSLFAYSCGKDENTTMWMLLISRLVVVIIVDYIALKYACKPYIKLIGGLKNSCVIFSVISALFYIILNFMSGKPKFISERPEEIPTFILMLILIPLVYYSIFQALKHQSQVHYLIQNEEILHTQVTALQSQLHVVHETEDKLRIYRHDVRHYIANLKTSIQSGDTLAALEMLGHQEHLIKQSCLCLYCENVTINATLAYYLENVKSAEISLSTHLDIPKDLAVDEMELSTVFANAIENAIIACRKIPENSPKKIEIICINQPNLVFEISNTYCGEVCFDENGLPIPSDDGHGIGTRSIAAFVKKYNAILDYKTENSIFKIRILIQPPIN